MDTSSLTRTKQQFARWSHFYDSIVFRLYFEPLYNKILQIINHLVEERPWARARVLDIACGTGEILIRLSVQYPDMELTGFDLVPEMLKKANEKAKKENMRWIEGDASHLPFANGSFDLVICSEAFHHFFQPEQTLSEIHRALTDGGFLLLVDPGANTWASNLLFNGLGKIFEQMNRCYSDKELTAMLHNASFKITRSFVFRKNNFFLCQKG